MSETPPVVVRRSRIQGRGVFATRDIAKGERIIEYVGRRISAAEADALCDDENMRRHHTFLFSVDDDIVIDATSDACPAKYINHSCEPNCESVVVRRRVYIDALRNIAEGDELFYDYWYVTDDDYTLDDLQRIYPCRCKAPSCRGTLARPPQPKRKTARAR
jgi:SET domain-containing protein